MILAARPTVQCVDAEMAGRGWTDDGDRAICGDRSDRAGLSRNGSPRVAGITSLCLAVPHCASPCVTVPHCASLCLTVSRCAGV